MKSKSISRYIHFRPISFLHILIFVAGMVIVFVSIFSDKLGFGAVGSFGIGQFLLCVIGSIVSLIGLLGKKIVPLYKGFAIVLLNTLMLISMIELGAIVAFRSGLLPEYRGIVTSYPRLPYYASQSWTEEYWREATLSEVYQYKPYVAWRHMPFEGETINFNSEGVRLTPGADCHQDSFKVFTFGGSTMLGWGAPDWGTIPAYLQSGLELQVDDAVCIMNLAEDGFVSTQSLITLIMELQTGNVPDVVIFYDGVNEAIAAYESGKPGVHVTLSKIEARFENPENPLLQWFKGSRTYALIERLARILTERGPENSSGNRLNFRSEIAGTDNLAELMARVYLNNYRMVGTLAQEYGFDYFFFLQPHLAVSNKALTEEEQNMKSKIDPAQEKLALSFYANVLQAEGNYTNIWSLANVLDGQGKQIWIDEAGHITPEGNYLVAQKMLDIIRDHIVKK